MTRTLARIFVLIFLSTFCLIPLTRAQFQFFDQMFGHPQQHQQQQQQRSGASQWAAHSDSVPCSEYLCPATLDCVRNPADCSCPEVQDVKCTIPDADGGDAATVVCVRGERECAEVERLSRLGLKKK